MTTDRKERRRGPRRRPARIVRDLYGELLGAVRRDQRREAMVEFAELEPGERDFVMAQMAFQQIRILGRIDSWLERLDRWAEREDQRAMALLRAGEDADDEGDDDEFGRFDDDEDEIERLPPDEDGAPDPNDLSMPGELASRGPAPPLPRKGAVSPLAGERAARAGGLAPTPPAASGPLSVVCRHCNAAIGEQCKTSGGHPTSPHAVRLTDSGAKSSPKPKPAPPQQAAPPITPTDVLDERGNKVD